MSKLSFRARALDASKPMPVYKTEEIPDLPDFAAINRAVPQMPTGMEKEEETEHHLQRALSAQQVYGTAEALVIPIPEIDAVTSTYKRLYEPEGGYKPPRQYIHVQPFAMDQEIPDYDMDSEDESWLGKQSRKLEVTPLKFETMMDRLEKGSGQTVMTLNEAKALLKEDDDLIIAVYDYWLNKRLKLQHALIPTVRTEKRDGSSTNNPYVAFRRRTEKMQTRKNRKNDEVSYEKMLKLRRDLNKALTILELAKRREKSKKELLKLTIEIVEKRHQMQDYDGKVYTEANAKRHTLPSTFIQSYTEYMNDMKWQERVSRQSEQTYSKKSKRKYNKRKEHRERTQSIHQHVPTVPAQQSVQLPQYTEVEVLNDAYSSEEELSPQLSASDHEQDSENDPDGPYAFKRKPGCQYHAPIDAGRGNWPWHGPEEGGFGETKYRYSLSSIAHPRPRCLGFGRRRLGRGGRIVFDRVSTEWDEALDGLDLISPGDEDDIASTYSQHIQEHNIPHFRPKTPSEEEFFGQDSRLLDTSRLSPPISTEFSLETYENHREQLLQMTRAQQEQLQAQDSISGLGSNGPSGFHSYCGTLNGSMNSGNRDTLGQSFSSQPNSKFTLDSERAQFAASAVLCNVTAISQQNSVTSSNANTLTASNSVVVLSTSQSTSSASGSLGSSVLVSPAINVRSSHANSPLVFQNGPIEVKPSVFSTSPAANVLQLNFPMNDSSSSSSASSKAATGAASAFSILAPDNISNNANTVLSRASTISLIATSAAGHSSTATNQNPAATFSIVNSTLNDHASRTNAAFTTTTNTTTVNNGNRIPLASVATKCVSPATPTLLKIGSMANHQRNNKETLEGASLLKDKAVPMEVT